MAEITGRQVAVFTVGAFGIIVAVNLVMAWKAVSTFPGLEVSNSYVASQQFDTRRTAQKALGWTMEASYDQGRARVAFADGQGNAVRVDTLSVLIGRTTAARDDVTPEFTLLGDVYEAEVPLTPGYWMFKVTARALDGTPYEKRVDLLVKG